MVKEKQKALIQYLGAYVVLLISFVLVIVAYYHKDDIVEYVIAGVVFVVFVVLRSITGKKIMCKDGYDLVQAFFFYKKCNRRGVTAKPDKLNKNDIETIEKIAKDIDYSKDFDKTKAETLYREGYNVSKLI